MRLVIPVSACVLAPSVYTLLSLAGLLPMTVAVFLGWLAWLQIVHVVAGVMLWRRRATLSTRMKAALLSWGGLAFWYWLPAPVYFVLTMNLDELQLAWTALAFFWEVPVVGGAFVLAAQRLYPARSRGRSGEDPARRYREVMRYPTLVAGLLFVFTFAGYAIGTLQLRIFAALPGIEQGKNLAHGLVISLLLAVFYHLALDRMLEPARARIAREAGVGAIVVRTVAGRILGVSLAVAVSGFALISLFVLQAFQGAVRQSAETTLARDLGRLAAQTDTVRHLGAFPQWGERGQLRLLREGEGLSPRDFAPATRALVTGHRVGVVHDSRHDLKVVGVVNAPRLGGRLVGVVFLTDEYDPLLSAARLLGLAGGSVLIVTVGMLVFASRASTQAVRALSSAVRRVEAGQGDEAGLRIETGDEIGELSAVVERYVRQSRDLQGTLEEKVREKTRELAARMKAEQQQARLAAVGQLAAGIAHDFNNILMTIVNSAELAQRRYSDPTFVHGRLELIVDQGERAAALVRQILDFSRQSPPALQPMDLAGLVEETIALLQRTLPATITIVYDAAPGPFGVNADHNQLRQVLTNLAVNARDAMPLGGELRFRLSRRQGDGQAERGPLGAGEWLVIEISDTGVGIPEEVRERIFEPFFTTKAPGRGTGLGLSQAYGIVQQHGGHIAVESCAEGGTIITIFLPALPEGASAVPISDDPSLYTGQGETLLVVEDEVQVRHTLAQILSDLNYRVLVAPSAEDGVSVYEANAKDVALVLTDLVMPGMGGIGLMRALRERAPHVPIVMMSGYVGESARETVEGVTAWVQKPVLARRLGQIIQEALATRV